jgi:drug/metabolite transporter (DMT)-like permease
MVENKTVVYLSMSTMLVSGTLGTITNKALNLTQSRGNEFNHPYFLTAGMFLGELFCFFYYFIYKKYEKSEPEIKKKGISVLSSKKKTCIEKTGKFVFIIPSSFDFIGSTLMFIGLIFCAPSVYQMIRGFLMIVVAIYSVVFLKIKLFRHQYLGVLCCFIGVVIVGLASVIYQAGSASNPVLGIIIIIIAQFFIGGLLISEQLFLEKVTTHPLQAVGVEGMTGLVYYIILLPVFNMVPCYNDDFCNGGFIENSVEAFKQMGDSWEISCLFLALLVSISLSNFAGVTTTKKAGALARSIVDSVTTLIIWMTSIAIGWEDFIWLQLLGFFSLVLGTLIYNEILVLPFWGFKESVEQRSTYMNDRARKNQFVAEDSEYFGFTPGATRNGPQFEHKESLLDVDSSIQD